MELTNYSRVWSPLGNTQLWPHQTKLHLVNTVCGKNTSNILNVGGIFATLYMLRDIRKDILLIINITIGTRTCLVSCVINNLRTRLLSLGGGRYIISIMKIWDKQIYKINLFATHVELLKPFLVFKGHCRAHEWASTEDAYLWCRGGYTHNWVDNCVRERLCCWDNSLSKI